jgi:hypothetical protein
MHVSKSGHLIEGGGVTNKTKEVKQTNHTKVITGRSPPLGDVIAGVGAMVVNSSLLVA